MALGSLAGAVILVGSFVAATETLGLDRYLPVTRGELIQHVGAQSRTNEQNDNFWERQFRAEQRSITRELKIYETQNPNAPADDPIIELYEQQIDDLQGTIESFKQ